MIGIGKIMLYFSLTLMLGHQILSCNPQLICGYKATSSEVYQ